MINLNFPTLNLKETGNRIHSLRVNSGYTVEDIASYMGFSGPQAVYKWEWGKSLPTVDNLYALSKLFGVAIEKILVDNDEYFLLYRKVKKLFRTIKTLRGGYVDVAKATSRRRRISQARFYSSCY